MEEAEKSWIESTLEGCAAAIAFYRHCLSKHGVPDDLANDLTRDFADLWMPKILPFAFRQETKVES